MKTKIFKNDNGSDYLIIKQDGDIALLVEIGGYDFVVTSYLSDHYWINGSYYFDVDEALKDFNERIESI